MSKKDKKGLSSEGDVQAIISLLPKLEKLLKNHRDAAKEYQKYRENGGNEILGLEKYLSCSEKTCGLCGNTEKTVCSKEDSAKPEATAEVAKAKKTKKQGK